MTPDGPCYWVDPQVNLCSACACEEPDLAGDDRLVLPCTEAEANAFLREYHDVHSDD